MATDYLAMLDMKPGTTYPIHLGVDEFELYSEYLVASNTNKCINYANLANLKEYIDLMDPAVFQMEDALNAHYQFVKHYIDAKIVVGLASHKLICQYVFSHVDDRFHEYIRTRILDSIEPDRLTKKDVEFINSTIYGALGVSFMHAYAKPLTQLIEDVTTNEFSKDPENTNSAIQLLQKMLSELTKVQRRAKQENRFNLTDANLYNAVMKEACERMLSDSQYINTGMQGLNLMLNGGLEKGRCYNIIGASGGGKSVLMLNLMKQIQLCNKGMQHKDPTKRPTILFISQENTLWETVNRIFNIYASVKSVKEFTASEIMEMLKSGGFTLVQDEDDIDIEFRYYGNMEIGVPDIKGMIEELDNEGREVICVIQDYVERLKPPTRTSERHQQLSDCSNQLHDLAAGMDIVVITGSQFNRQGTALIEQQQAEQKMDIGKKVKSSDISESLGMLKNFDVNIGIVIEYDAMEDRFMMSFRKLKMRGADSGDLNYFLQPFVGTRSKIQLMMDFGLERSVYKRSIQEDARIEMIDTAEALEYRARKTKKLKRNLDIDLTMDEDFDKDFFENMIADTEREKYADKRACEGDSTTYDEDGYIVLCPTPRVYAAIECMKRKEVYIPT